VESTCALFVQSGMTRRLGELSTLVLLLIILGCERPPTDYHVRVADVLDGDDIVVRLLVEGDVNIRYLGIDAPEINHPRFGLEPGGHEAAQTNREIVLGKWVRFERDEQKLDRFGRVLAYVWVHQPDGSEVMANAEMLWRGHARVQSGSPNAKYDSYFRDLQTKARDQGVGLWSSEAGRAWASRR
jgi:micrococcal nuclease